MGSSENIAVVRRLYEAFEAGDVETVTSTFDEGVVWHEGGIHTLAGEYRGIDAVMAVNGRAAELTNGTLGIEVHDVLGSDDHVVILQRVTATKDGAHHGFDEVLVVHLANDKVTEVWVAYPEPEKAVTVFGSSATS